MKIKEKDILRINYKLLTSGYGVLCEAKAVSFPIQSEVEISFEGIDLPEDAQLVISSGEHSYYRNIGSGETKVSGSLLKATVKMAITSRETKKSWKCETVHFSSLDSQRMIFLPFDLDSQKLCRQALIKLDEAEKKISDQNEEIETLKSRLDEYMEYWDII